MAIEYHEGLPGAGKSYEAVVFHIIPALKERRSVVTNIRGMNFEKLAELSGQPLEMVRLLLTNVEPAEQDSEAGEVQRCINEMCDKTPDNALIVWDEIQDYFPSGNTKLPLNQQKFWTEHRHRGLDIIIMGQDRTDVHKLIRNRIRTVIYFLKLEAIGRSGHYKWEIYQKQKLGKFVKTGSGTRSYEEKYFGTYMSHRREGTRSKVYTTERTNFLKASKTLVFGPPIAFILAIWGAVHLWGFFHKPLGLNGSTASSQRVEAKSAPVIQQSADHTDLVAAGLVNPPPPDMLPSVDRQADSGSKKDQELPAVDYFDRMAKQLQVRASAIVDSKKPGKELMGYVELLDSSFHQKELFSVQELQALGWKVSRTGYGLLLEKEGVSYVARSWPVDVYGRVDNRTRDSLAGSSASAQTKPASQRDSLTVTVIPDSEYPSRPWR